MQRFSRNVGKGSRSPDTTYIPCLGSIHSHCN